MFMAKHKKKNKYKRTLALMTALIVLIVASVSTTIAFLITGTNPITNIFTPSKVTTEVVFSDDGTSASIQNKDDTAAYIRAAVVVNWKRTNGTNAVYAKAPVENTDYTITFNENDWIKREYGNGEVIYYYKLPVHPNYKTPVLFSNFALKDGATVPEGYELVIEVVGSGIQSTPANVVTDNWKVNLNGSNITSVN